MRGLSDDLARELMLGVGNTPVTVIGCAAA
jgi:hypothetical protein